MNEKLQKGSCLCGSVEVSSSSEEKSFHACHCGICRKWGGGPALTVDAGKNISTKGDEYISVYESSAWAERGFCKRCGTHLFYRLKETDYINYSLGLFENYESFKFREQIYIDHKPGNYEFANPTEKLTEAEVIAKFQAT